MTFASELVRLSLFSADSTYKHTQPVTRRFAQSSTLAAGKSTKKVTGWSPWRRIGRSGNGRVQGRHLLQTSDALGAAAQLGPDAQAAVVELNK